MAKYITKCGRCGSREFTVDETYQWRAEIDDTGVLNCTNVIGGIDCICCTDCGEPYATDRFTRIDFN